MATIAFGTPELERGHTRAISVGQTIRLDLGASFRMMGSKSATFSGTLTLHSAGSGMDEYFGLDKEGDRVALIHNATALYVETAVHIDGQCVGSYIDLRVGPYLNIRLRNASLEHVRVLLQHIQFTASNNLPLSSQQGLRTITAELIEQHSGMSNIVQTMVDVVDSCPLPNKPITFAE